jgi:protein BCP1
VRSDVNGQDKPVIQALIKYFLEKSKSNKTFQEQLSSLEGGEGDIALVLAERIINMPAAVAAPSYKMLLEEIEWANEEVSSIFVDTF